LAAAEKRLLIWIARRLPESINSDHLSALGLVSMLCAGVSFAAFRISPLAGPIVVFALVANWFGDSLDGTLARIRGHERPRYGFYVDHVIDLAGAAFLLGGLACSGLMNPVLATILLSCYLLVSAEAYLATHTVGVFRMAFLGLGPTELRILVAAGTLRVVHTPDVTFGVLGSVKLFDIGGIVGSIGLAIVFLASAARNIRELYGAEPIDTSGSRTETAA
jgi:phosphatidylglycerophosphate synthase